MSIITYLLILILITLSIMSFLKKKYEFFFFTLYAILPAYFGLEISPSLPILSATRIGMLLLIAYAIKSTHKEQLSALKENHHIFNHLIIFFIVHLIPNIYHLFHLRIAFKSMFGIVFEEILLICMFLVLFRKISTIEKALQIFTCFSGLVFFFGILESIFNVSISDDLFTVKRSLLNTHYIRLGLMRSTFTFGIPSFFATYCILLLPLIVYFLEKTKEKKYIFLLILDLYSLIHTGCRAQLIFSLIMLSIILICAEKEKKKNILKAYTISVGTLLAIITILCLSSASLKYYYIGTAKSVLNEVGFDFDLNADSPNNDSGFGTNQDGTYSRMAQLTGITYTLKNHPLVGFGPEAQNRRVIQYFWHGKWRYSSTYDVGYVAIICNEGLIGFVAYVILAVGIMMMCIRNKSRLNRTFLQIYIGYSLCLFANDMMYPFFWSFTGLFYAYQLTFSSSKKLPAPENIH